MQDPNSLVSRLHNYFLLALPKTEDQSGNETVLFETPQTDSDETAFYEELLVYGLLMEIVDMHNPNPIVSVTLGPPGLSLGDRKPFKLSQPEKKLLTQACPDIFRLRFARNPGEKVALKFYSSRLPKGTKITLPPVTSTENTGNEKRIIVLTKHNFFTVEITIEPGMWSGQRTVPVNAHISPQFVSKSKVLMFQISMVAKFARLTAGNYQTGELKDWARWMFGRLQSRFSDTISN